MELSDYFFQRGVKEKLNDLSSQIARQTRYSIKGLGSKRSVDEDIGFLALLGMALLTTLEEKGVVTRAEILERIQRLDAFEGDPDGAMSPDVVRGMMGVPKKPAPRASVRRFKR